MRADPFKLNAALDRLTDNSQTEFSVEDAKYIIASIEKRIYRPFSFRFRNQADSGSVTGNSPGVGNVEIETEGKKKEIIFGKQPETRIGGYVITHTNREVTISLMWADTYEDMSGKLCVLHYDRRGNPTALKIAKQSIIGGFGLYFSMVKFIPWKTPAVEAR